MRVRPAVREALAGGSDRRTGCGGFFAGVVGVIRAGCERCFLLKSCLWRKLFSRGRGGAVFNRVILYGKFGFQRTVSFRENQVYLVSVERCCSRNIRFATRFCADDLNGLFLSLNPVISCSGSTSNINRRIAGCRTVHIQDYSATDHS